MAEESQQETMTFETEEAKTKALDDFDEETGKVEDLQKIRNAEIKVPEEPKEEGAEGEPPETPPIPEPKPEEKTPESTPEVKKEEPETPPEESKEFTLKSEDLPGTYKTPGEAFKALNEKEDLIARQGEKIQEQQTQLAETLKQATERADAAEAQLKTVQEQAGVVKKPAEESAKVPDSKMSQITALQKEISAIEDSFDEKAITKSRDLNILMMDELARTTTIANNAISEAQTVKQEVGEYKNLRDGDLQTEKNKEALRNEFAEMDNFSKEYKDEYGLSKSASEIDQEYIDWRRKVALQYYGVLPDSRTEEGKNQLGYAMYMLKQGSPDLIEKCRTANIPTVPDKDMENYLKICGLIDERDGVKYDPVEKKRIQLTKFDTTLQKNVPAGFPSLKATLENRRVDSGYYKNRELEANRKGAKSALDAASKRDTKELENDTSSQAVVGEMTVETATKVLNEFDLEAARDKYYKTGDKSVFDEYNAARVKHGQPPMDLTNVVTLK